MGANNRQIDEVLVPIEQDTVNFYGHDLVAARLADGRTCAVLHWLCDGLSLDFSGQLQRIKRKTAPSSGLLYVQVETPGGRQAMPSLMLRVLPGWLYTIDENRVKPEARDDAILFQNECTDALAEHFANKAQATLMAPESIVPAEPIRQPERPAPDTPRSAMIEYYRAMISWLKWQEDMAQWREHTDSQLQDHETQLRDQEQQIGELHARLEGNEEISRMLAAFVARQGPQTLTPEHQATVKHMAARLDEVGGAAFGAIYADLNASFHVGRFSDIPEAEWARVMGWFQTRIAAVEKRRRT